MSLLNGPIGDGNSNSLPVAYTQVVWLYMTDGRIISEEAQIYMANMLFSNKNVLNYGGQTVVYGRVPISTFYHFHDDDSAGKTISANIAGELRRMFRGTYYESITDPCAVSNLNIINAVLNDRKHEFWDITMRANNQHLLEEVLLKSKEDRRWALDMMIRYNSELICCFVVRFKNGAYEIGPGQAMEIQFFKAIVSQLRKPFKVYFVKVFAPNSVEPMLEYSGAVAMNLLDELQASITIPSTPMGRIFKCRCW